MFKNLFHCRSRPKEINDEITASIKSEKPYKILDIEENKSRESKDRTCNTSRA